jgi:hypothetical protein
VAATVQKPPSFHLEKAVRELNRKSSIQLIGYDTHTHTHPYYRKSDDDTQSTKRYNIDTYKMAGCSSVFYLFTTGEWGGQPMCEKVYSRYTYYIYIYIVFTFRI